MSAAEVLRARIERLSLAIEHHKQVIKDLESSKCNARRELNRILDPMARLPLEISSEIFIRCLPDSPRPHSGEAPLLFLPICRLWADIAIVTPSLWTSIRCESIPDAVNLDIWLQRARSLPLCISAHGKLVPDVANVLSKHAHRLQVFESEFHHFKQLITPFPLLAKLTVVGVMRDRIPPHEYLDILRAAPALVECHFISTLFYPRDAEPLRHPRLRVNGTTSINAAYMFKYLTLPALSTLFIAGLDFVSGEFTAFLTKSVPPLQFLRIVITELDDHALNQSLRLVPTVTDLRIQFRDSTIDPFLLLEASVLTSNANPDPTLPNLCDLRIELFFTHNVDYDAVIAALSTRRAAASCEKLQSFTLISENPAPDPDTIATLRQFAADSGMRIRVGTRSCNYI
ncbi:F-box domain-containing protein [Mycena sanguinolenta]|uniref:F-box domain-containing protein n=1 Tax=Mycena sanguinolenta TaxID=230812 RepID=A0A8H6Z4S6_9AGAR|nr:F-box domain-containing protein [Mycena sanguinolenta]